MNRINKPLEEMAASVAFEFFRFDLAAKLPEFNRTDELGGLVKEAFLIHFRNLLDFFYGVRRHPMDPLARDYLLPHSKWQPQVPGWLDDYRKRCNKLLAHLSYERVEYLDGVKRTWDLEDKVQHLTEEWHGFLEALPPERRLWFRPRVR